MESAEAVLRFLESVGRRSEAEYWLAVFREMPKEQFAVIAVGANVARIALDAVVLHLRFLADLGLYPVVVLGLFDTGEADEHAARIARRLGKVDVATEVLTAFATPSYESAREACRAGRIPVVAFGASEAPTVEARFDLLGGLLSDLGTRKLIFLHRAGGLRERGALLPLVNLVTDHDRLLASPELTRREKQMLVQVRKLVLERLTHKMGAAVTSPLNLLRELFTGKGAGTLLRRGSVVTRHATLAEIDREKMRALLQSSFGRAPSDAFFERPLGPVYLDEAFRGAAIVCPTPDGAYLSKFAVEAQAQGEGLGRDLWDALTAEHRTLFWRSRAGNPIAEWYTKLCDGLVRRGEWTVYFLGVPPERIADVVAWTLAQPDDLPTTPPSQP